MNDTLYTLGCGDRFGHQAKAQLAAYIEAAKQGISVCPVWNKSHREHTTVHTDPVSVRIEADEAVQALGWTKPYFVDADHISLKNVDGFLDSSDFFTIDVADSIGKPAAPQDVDTFTAAMAEHIGEMAPELPALFGDKLFVSGTSGFDKETVEGFTDLLDQLGWNPATTLFIDDNAGYVANAITAGLVTHVFQDADGLHALLSELGLVD